MSIRRYTLSIGLLLLGAANLFSQVAVGHWRTHFAFTNLSEVVETPSFVFSIGDGKMIGYDKEENRTFNIDRTNHLNDNNPHKLAYVAAAKQLVIAYENGNIDLFDGEYTVNIPDLKLKMLNASKKPNALYVHNKEVYLCYNFGIILLNIDRQEIIETYFTQSPVHSALIFNNQLYAARQDGIWEGSLNSNLLDNTNWKQVSINPSTRLLRFNDHLCALINGDIYQKDKINDTFTRKAGSSGLTGMTSYGDQLLAWGKWGTANTLFLLSKTFSEKTITPQNLIHSICASSSTSFWFTDSSGGLYSGTADLSSLNLNYTDRRPIGIERNTVQQMHFAQEKLLVACGGRTGNNLYRPATYLVFENETWRTVNLLQDAYLSTIGGTRKIDLMSMNEDPKEPGHYFATTWCDGVYEIRDNKVIKVHNNDNSTIRDIFNQKGYMRIDGGIFDSKENYWITGSQVKNNQINLLTPDGKWYGLTYADLSDKSQLAKILPTSHGTKWVISKYLPADDGIFVFNEKETYSNPSDDDYKFFKTFIDQDGNNIAPTEYYDVAEDKKGNIWIGTTEGPLLISSPNKVFESSFTCTRVKVPRNDGTNLADYLLENITVTAITVDGGNRKWMGTNGKGVYLINENGTQILEHYTTENSILPSNDINALAINPISGELFIGTTSGIASYRTPVNEPQKTYSNVYAFPNPIRPDYSGLITITGLRANSVCRITDINGNSVIQGIAIGGQFTWDGYLPNRKRPQTGIYLVWGAQPDGSSGIATKILFVQ